MLVLFETAAGYTLWRVNNTGILEKEDICSSFPNPEDAQKYLSLISFEPFTKTIESVEAMKSLQNSELTTSLNSFLKENILNVGIKEKLTVSDTNLARLIQESLGIECISSPNQKVPEIFRFIRQNLTNLIPSISPETFRALELGVSHELSAQVLKFSPSKVDSMIVHSVGLLEELDKELNNYGMRVREWYGWHFPELKNITTDNLLYSQIVLRIGRRDGIENSNLEDILTPPLIEEIKKISQRSIGTVLSDSDLDCIKSLCIQVIELTGFRNQIVDYIRVRMQAIAPNLTELVGETVGSRLIAHAGSLQSLAKLASSTVQIYGAEKALFRALKEDKKTPKYGYIFHAQLVSHATQNFKGQTARSLAAKISLSSRVDSYSEEPNLSIGKSDRERLENQLRSKEGQKVKFEISRAKNMDKPLITRIDSNPVNEISKVDTNPNYKVQNDFQLDINETLKKKKKKKNNKI